jgi:hypothetical protein
VPILLIGPRDDGAGIADDHLPRATEAARKHGIDVLRG